MSKSAKYYAKGKLLITGEYAVLDGAKALAIPCNFGQSLNVSSASNPNLFLWESITVDGETWLEITFDSQLNVLSTTNSELAKTLQQLLQFARKLNPNFSKIFRGVRATTQLEFDRSWGLGSSSTLVHLISQWAEINPYKLLKNTFGGSGYDIACANAEMPIIYQVKKGQPNVTTVNFSPSFTDKMWFIHLGEKQISKNEIAKYSDLKFDRIAFTSKISAYTNKILHTDNLQEFTTVLNQHEQLVSSVLGIPNIKDERFSTIRGSFKSLGAWGGDFVLFIGEESEVGKIKSMGYETILTWNEMLINSVH